MLRETITPTDEAHWKQMRTSDLTSTDVAALFGLSPYTTLFEVWHRKREGQVVEIADNPRMRWGRRLEDVIARGIGEDQGWKVAPMKDYMRLPELRIGSSFDYRISGKAYGDRLTATEIVDTAMYSISGQFPELPEDGILEIKTVDALAFKNGWTIEDDELVAPAHIEIQVQHQMLVSGLKWAYIGAMVGGNDVRLLRREADEAVHMAILQKSRAFWKSIDAGTPPPARMPEDAGVIIRLHQHAEPGKVIDAPDASELIAAYQAAGEAEKKAKEDKETAKARLLELIGDAEKATCGPHTISASYQGEVEIPAYTRAGFRSFRITTKKPKKA